LTGDWYITGDLNNQFWDITSYDPNTGALTGEGSGNGFHWSVTGSSDGTSISMDFIYTNLPTYFGRLSGEFTGPCSIEGEWFLGKDLVYQGTWEGTKVDCNPGSGGTGAKRRTSIKLFC